jgi:hypothetical protein
MRHLNEISFFNRFKFFMAIMKYRIICLNMVITIINIKNIPERLFYNFENFL